ncbi:MAG: glycolate oxidase subunit GlcE [Alphaproteobacteria bacterium]|nr:glycolate oxidase subunit GlcE [Alphaproteobacteria bacterium]
MARFLPQCVAELAEIVAAAADEQSPLAVCGSETKRNIGRTCAIADVLSTAAIRGIKLYEPEELVLTVYSGTPLGEIEAALAQRDQHLAFEPPRFHRLLGTEGATSIGGVVATGLSGPRRMTAGAVRDHVLGFQAVNGRGELIKAGGRVVKNVTGYDLSKLMAGSFGTLAVLSEITLKVLPRPARVQTLVAQGVGAREGVSLLSRALGGPFVASGAAWLPPQLAGNGDSLAAIRLEGTAESVAARGLALRTALSAFSGTLDHDESCALWQSVGEVEGLADMAGAVWRISVPPMSGPDILEAVPGATGFLDWGGGLVWLLVPETGDCAAERIRAAVAKVGGHATLFRASAEMRRTIPVFQPQEGPLAALTRRVKESFDPLHILNPGRMYPDF